MKTILVTAYAVNPFKGSEDGMGWNFILQIAKYNNVIAVTRKNNRPHIEKYLFENKKLFKELQSIEFLYFDWFKPLLFWKKGSFLSLIYFYLWQFSLAIWIIKKQVQFDIAHNLNFHNDWTPTFLWLCGKPFVWGPVGHHSKIPRTFLLQVYGMKEYIKDRFTWILKKIFWAMDPFLFISKKTAKHILCMNSAAIDQMKLSSGDISCIPSVAATFNDYAEIETNVFNVLSAGRLVALKGFDITIKSFAAFYKSLNNAQQANVKLTIAGSGNQEKMLTKMVKENGVEHCTEVIKWLPKNELDNLYKTASLFLFPSYEGAGMVVAEAMSFGLPVLCWKNNGPGEMVHPHSTLTVSYQSYNTGVVAFAEKISSVFHDKILYENERRLAYRRFVSAFQWNIRGEQLRKIYASISIPSTSSYTIKPLHANL